MFFFNDERFTTNMPSIANYFLHLSRDKLIDKTYEQNGIGSVGTSINIKINSETIEGDTVEKFKTWLSSHNTIVYYLTKTPYFIDLGTLPEIPSTFKGVNNINVETNIGNTNIDIVYVEDLKVAIDKLQKQIETMQIQAIETKEE